MKFALKVYLAGTVISCVAAPPSDQDWNVNAPCVVVVPMLRDHADHVRNTRRCAKRSAVQIQRATARVDWSVIVARRGEISR